MGIRKNLVVLSLLTGALISTPYSSIKNEFSYDLNLFYNVSSSYVFSDEDLIYNTNISIPAYDAMVPQGLCSTDEYFFTSSYDYYHNSNSCINVLDKTGNLINTCDLNNKAHVGGIAYDANNNLIWVTGFSGNVNAYRYESIIESSTATPIFSNIDVSNDLVNYKNPFLESASFLTVFKDRLFVGNFNLRNQGIFKEYKITLEDNVLSLELLNKVKIPNKVQGMTFYEKDDHIYIIFSRSYGQNINSILQIFEYDESILDYNDTTLNYKCLECPSMLEQTTIIGDNLYSIYESSALPYSCSDSTGNIMITDVHKLIKKDTID